MFPGFSEHQSISSEAIWRERFLFIDWRWFHLFQTFHFFHPVRHHHLPLPPHSIPPSPSTHPPFIKLIWATAISSSPRHHRQQGGLEHHHGAGKPKPSFCLQHSSSATVEIDLRRATPTGKGLATHRVPLAGFAPGRSWTREAENRQLQLRE